MNDASRTASHWDDDPWNTGETRFWLQLPSVQRRQAIKESGRPDSDWIDYTLQTYLAGRLPLTRCLSLGCGRGRVERQWAERQAFLACDAYEYVGPNRFQFPAYQRQVIQACLDLLPPAYRRLSQQTAQAKLGGGDVLPRDLRQRLLDKWRDGDLLAAVGRRLRLLRAARTGAALEKTTANLPTERSVIAVDPSEAVRSAEIVPVLQQYFDLVELRPLGGTILQFLLADIAGNFQQDEAGAQLLEMLFAIEDALMAAGHLDSDFAYIVAAPRH